MVNEKDIIKLLQGNYNQLRQQQAQINKLIELVCGLTRTAGGYCQVLPFGVKDVTTAQLVDAYERGLNIEQWIVNTFLDNFFKVVLPVLYRSLIS